ncbi:MFS general substrate transporter [Amylocystis lapponica]|nr:MFS general substrate transporter [Amylocystis lapponica]
MSSHTTETLSADTEKQDKQQAAALPPPPDADSLSDQYQVVLDPEDDPKNMSKVRRWIAVSVIGSAALCATFASSVASFTEEGLANDLHVSHEVTILSISLFVEGLGLGPLLVGPLSELYGRTIIYRASYFFFWAFTWPVAFAPNIAVFLVFRFVTGLCGSAFLSVAGGSVGDMFANFEVATPMAIYSVTPFIGPTVGPLIGGYDVSWRWTYRVLLMWQFAEFWLIVLLVPETYEPILLKWKARRLRKETGDDKYYAPLERQDKSVWRGILFSCYTPFQLLLYDRMALFLDIWNALILGIMYLTFQAFPIIFEGLHGFNVQSTGLSFLGIGIGMGIALLTQPWWNRHQREQTEKYNGSPPPETRLVMGKFGAVIVPLSLYWLAFTTYKHVHWIAPIIASIPFGTGVYFIFTSTFTYLVVAYRPIAASAMAANSAVRSTFAAAFPLFAGAMYHRLGTVGATALLAGLCTIMAPLPFIYYKIGARLRATSRFAAKS